MRKIEQIIQLKPNEEIVTVVREYIITQLPRLAIGAALYFGWLFLLYPLFSLGVWGLLIFSCGLLAILLWIGRYLYGWYFETCIVTNLRCIDIQQHGFFSKTVREIPWKMVQDVSFIQRGMFATLGNYGAVHLLLDRNETVVLQHVYQPAKLRDILSEYVQALH